MGVVDDFYDGLLASHCACLAKQDVPEVEAVIRTVIPLIQPVWERFAREAERELLRELRRLGDDLPTPSVDPVTRSEDPDRTLEAILLALLALVRRRVDAAGADLERALDAAGRRLLARGASSVGEGLDFVRAPTLRPGAVADMLTLFRGRVTTREGELREHLRTYLTSRAARTPSPSAPLPAPRSTSLEAWRAALRDILGRQTERWLPFTVDQWAYRWYSIGAFEAGAQAGVVAFQARAVIDTQTTPFCRWVDGRIISVGRARRQVQRHVEAALAGDVAAIVNNWPLIPSSVARGSDVREFRRAFARVGLPPYHGRCRTRPVPLSL